MSSQKVAILTGASSGIGYAVAELLAQDGYSLVIGSRNPAEAAERLSQISHAPVIPIAGNFSDAATTRLLIEAAKDLGGLDAVMLNHGGPPVQSFMETTEEQWQASFDLMVQAPLRLLREAVPEFEKKGAGRVVAITSFTVKTPFAGIVLSNSLRAALLNALKTAAIELGTKGILINAVAPGYIATDRLIEWNKGQAEQRGVTAADIASQSTAQIPLRRHGLPKEVAELVFFLLSERNGYVNGQQIHADGGLVTAI